jgi:hypothetical protein
MSYHLTSNIIKGEEEQRRRNPYTFHMETRNQKRLRQERENKKPIVYLHSLVYKKDPNNQFQTTYYSMCRAELEVGGKKYFIKDMEYQYIPTYMYERDYRQHILRFQVENEYYLLCVRPNRCPYKKNGENRVRYLYSTTIIEKLVKTKCDNIYTNDFERVEYKLVSPNVVKKMKQMCLKQRRKTLRKTIYDIGFCKDVAGVISSFVM